MSGNSRERFLHLFDNSKKYRQTDRQTDRQGKGEREEKKESAKRWRQTRQTRLRHALTHYIFFYK